jgi:hypothetical protein
MSLGRHSYGNVRRRRYGIFWRDWRVCCGQQRAHAGRWIFFRRDYSEATDA